MNLSQLQVPPGIPSSSSLDIYNLINSPEVEIPLAPSTAKRPLVPPPLLLGRIPSSKQVSSESVSAPVVISAEPKMRDLQKELTGMVPLALLRNTSNRPSKKQKDDAYVEFMAQFDT